MADALPLPDDAGGPRVLPHRLRGAGELDAGPIRECPVGEVEASGGRRHRPGTEVVRARHHVVEQRPGGAEAGKGLLRRLTSELPAIGRWKAVVASLAGCRL